MIFYLHEVITIPEVKPKIVKTPIYHILKRILHMWHKEKALISYLKTIN